MGLQGRGRSGGAPGFMLATKAPRLLSPLLPPSCPERPALSFVCQVPMHVWHLPSSFGCVEPLRCPEHGAGRGEGTRRWWQPWERQPCRRPASRTLRTGGCCPGRPVRLFPQPVAPPPTRSALPSRGGRGSSGAAPLFRHRLSVVTQDRTATPPPSAPDALSVPILSLSRLLCSSGSLPPRSPLLSPQK